MDRIHFIEGDTDSAYWAISGNPNEDFTQQFNVVIRNSDIYNENAKYFFPSCTAGTGIRGDVYDEKKILGLAIEQQGPSLIALAPKNYIIFKNYCDDSKIKLKGVNQKTNKITKDQIIDCINEGKITKCTNMRFGQKNHQMSQLTIEKNGITGIHTKMIVLENQSYCPLIYGLTAKDYSFTRYFHLFLRISNLPNHLFSIVNSYFFNVLYSNWNSLKSKFYMVFSSYTYLRSVSPRLTPKQMAWVSILAVLNKQVGR
ncbi:MAG: hypothetical protein EZS28_030671 [Streblomastix strix]|uniref:Uncharacterized protein n=1 Tax=Streblomastix strix TaxID=222440 RepID=A0A5J4UUT5_9EUKA|nr:MAG: hypothetical protein EZS28_030671 [Streblomastix strix]